MSGDVSVSSRLIVRLSHDIKLTAFSENQKLISHVFGDIECNISKKDLDELHNMTFK